MESHSSHAGKHSMAGWIYAFKVGSWPKILLPAVLGQALGSLVAGQFSWAGFLLSGGFSVAGLLYIVLMNDWGDQTVDRIKRKLFPESCSPKTIPDGILSSDKVFRAGTFMAALSLILGGSGIFIGRFWLPVLTTGGLLIFYCYTFPPLKLNYRGGGEILEMAGVGFYLPYLNAYGQSGILWDQSYWILTGFLGLSFASALASGISDEESDLAGGKKTFTTILGNKKVRVMVSLFVTVTPFLWSVILWHIPTIPGVILVLPAVILFSFLLPMLKVSRFAGTREFSQQKRYKHFLHMGIWGCLIIWILELSGLLLL